MKTVKLTKTTAELAAARGGRYIIWDSELTGFGLRVSANGARSWVIKYRADGGGRRAPIRWLTLGGYPTVSADDARKKARKDLAAVELGMDPAGDLAARRRELTVAQLIDFYEEEGCVVQRGIRQGEPMKPKTKAFTLARLRHHVVPILGKRRASEITEGDIESFSRAVTNGKTACEKGEGRKKVRIRGGAGAARKVVRDLSAVFSFAGRHRIVTINPVEKASVRKTDNKCNRFLSIEEVKRLGEALDKLEKEGVNPKATNITRLWALSGCRRDEIAGLKWTEVDFERGLLIFDDTKTGRSIRPLGAAAVTLLEALQAEAGDGAVHVFPAERGDGFYSGTKKVWPEVIKRAGLPGVTPHTLRHTIGGTAGSAGEALLMIGAILGHANARSTAIYAHVAHDPARLAADRVTAGIAEALGKSGNPTKDAPALDMNAIVAALQDGRSLPPELAKALATFASSNPGEG
jgi:integrase